MILFNRSYTYSIFKYNLLDNATISLRCFIEEVKQDNYLFENIDSNGNLISLLVDNEMKLKILYNEGIYESNIEINLNEWNDIIFTWKAVSISDLSKKRTFSLYVNDISYTKEVIDDAVFSGFTTYIGGNKVSADLATLHGQIEMLLISTECLNTQATNIKNSNKIETIIYKYDDFGMLTKKEISKDNDLILNYNYYFNSVLQDEEDNSNNNLVNAERIGTLVREETIVLNGETLDYVYEYDTSGNLIKVYENDVLYKEYTYNYKNELTSENDRVNQIAIEYNIVSNGNIGSIYKTNYGENYSQDVYYFEYNSSYSKDILTKVTKNDIMYNVSYEDSLFTNPTNITVNNKSLSLTWTGRRLTKTVLSNTEHLEYKYNDKGERISKNLIHSVTGSKEHKYYYESGKLVCDIYTDEAKEDTEYKYFEYDSKGILTSVIIDNTKYYYIMDIFNTIIGLTDASGALLVRYHYDAYGNVINIIGNTTLGNNNPIRYKGYYYDSETGIYYL